MLTLPDELRAAFKSPFGDVYTDAETLLAAAGRPVVAVGDVVTYHLREAGHDPAVAVVDGRTKREAVDAEIRAAVADGDRRIEAVNEPGSLSRDLLVALREAVAADANTLVAVDGEEDLATLPAVLAAPPSGAVVYGQPDEGMVLVDVTPDARAEMRDLFVRFDGDVDAALSTLGV